MMVGALTGALIGAMPLVVGLGLLLAVGIVNLLISAKERDKERERQAWRARRRP